MSDFLQALLARSFGTDGIIQPRPISRFEKEREIEVDPRAQAEVTAGAIPEIDERGQAPTVEVHRVRFEQATPAVEPQRLPLERTAPDEVTHQDPITVADRNSLSPPGDRSDDSHPGRVEREELVRVREERILEVRHASLSPKPTEIRPVSRPPITADSEQLQSPETHRLEYSQLRPIDPVEASRKQDVQVHVTIGKIEVGSAPKPPAPSKTRAPAARPAVTLDEYLRRRSGGPA
jgi:hypothetical protein